MNHRRNFKAATTGAVVAAAAMLTNMVPASAAGAGVSTGFSDISASGPVSTPLCIKANTGAKITLNNVGTLQAGTAAPYVGASTSVFTLGGFFFGPQGTYTSAGCGGAPNAASVSGSLTTGSTTSCSGLTGTYTRVTDAYTIDVTGTCTFSGAPVRFIFSGHQTPCPGDFVPNCDGPLNPTEFVGDYTQA